MELEQTLHRDYEPRQDTALDQDNALDVGR